MRTLKFKFQKLGRDKTEEIFANKGITPICKRLTGDDLLAELKNKVMEEALEVCQARTSQELAEEIGDLQEVLDALALAFGLEIQDVVKARQNKMERLGSFSKGVYFESVLVPEGHPDIVYYRAHPQKHPEIN